jgi:hypothetical protein
MAVTITGIRFDFHDYDERGDTLFLSVRRPNLADAEPAETYDTPGSDPDAPRACCGPMHRQSGAAARAGLGASQPLNAELAVARQ